jgi:N-acetylglutamate synthase-like GNAT family acetyltransferase
MTSKLANIEISDNKARLDIETVHGFMKRSFWAAQRTRETLVKSIQNSLCFGAYQEGRQIGFARVVTDQSTFAYLCDVFVDEKFRGLGVSREMMEKIMKHPTLQNLRRFMLATRDAQGLYEKFGFKAVDPNRVMEIKIDGV